MKLSSKLLTLLMCPVTSGPLVYDADAQELISHEAGLVYPVRDGIPILLADYARKIDRTGVLSVAETAQIESDDDTSDT